MHVDADLSAYLDGELAPAEGSRVAAHLDGCARCRARLAELRATATLIAGLPLSRPSRSLVPRVGARWNWLRPVRSLSAFASGAFLFVFLVSAVAQSGSDLGGGPTAPFGGPEPLGAPGAAPQPATGAAASPERAVEAPAAAATPTAAEFSAVTPSPTAAADARQEQGPEAFAVTTAEAEARERRAAGLDESGPAAPSPFVWLALAAIAGAIALVAHGRLRAA